MLPKVSWMVAADSLILWFLSSSARWRLVVTPSVVAINTGLSSSHANRRMNILEDGGLLEQVDERGYYRISDLGERFVLGDVTKEELEAKDPEID